MEGAFFRVYAVVFSEIGFFGEGSFIFFIAEGSLV